MFNQPLSLANSQCISRPFSPPLLSPRLQPALTIIHGVTHLQLASVSLASFCLGGPAGRCCLWFAQTPAWLSTAKDGTQHLGGAPEALRPSPSPAPTAPGEDTTLLAAPRTQHQPHWPVGPPHCFSLPPPAKPCRAVTAQGSHHSFPNLWPFQGRLCCPSYLPPQPAVHSLSRHCLCVFTQSSERIPWTEEPGGLQFMGSHRVRPDRSNLARTRVVTGLLVSICTGDSGAQHSARRFCSLHLWNDVPGSKCTEGHRAGS